jgi:hypothetical protein
MNQAAGNAKSTDVVPGNAAIGPAAAGQKGNGCDNSSLADS